MKIKISHPEKMIYPKVGIKKLDIIKYYESIFPSMMPFIKNRLLSVLKCPQGSQKHCFFQKNLNQKNAPGVFTLKTSGEEKDYFYIKNEAGLLYLTQLNVIEFHPWGSSIKNIEVPDIMFFDLDPSPSVSWKDTVFLAHFMREQLEKIRLKSFIKTTGGKGLHIVIPIAQKYTWDEVKNYSKAFAETIVTLQPKISTVNFSKAKRKGKILIDYVRNTRGATAVAPYSLRANENATIATPISWDELKVQLKPNQFNIKNFSKRIKKSEASWENFNNVNQKLKKM